ncbi:putative magnesium transporter NIPA9 [Drosera capensis]
MASAVSKLGFVLLEQGFSKLLIPASILVSVCCSGIGFFYQTRGLKHGRAIVVSTCAAVASIVTGVLAGMFALGEKLPSAPGARLILLVGWLLIIVGVILLVSSSRLVTYLPWLARRSARGGHGKNLNLKQSASSSSRDNNPSAVIHTTTLHHLLSSPVKEKP